MHILFLTDNFPPEVNAPASRTFEHCCEWVAAGQQVTVITCAPNFPRGVVYEGYRNWLWQAENMNGIRVVRVWSYIAANEGFVRRILDYMSFMVAAVLLGAPFVRKVDIVVGTSPQFFTVCAAYAVSRYKRVPFVFELRDLWPESIKAVGAMRDNFVVRILERIEMFLYRKAARIIVVTESFKRILVGRGIDGDKIDIVTNGVDLSSFRPVAKDAALVARYGLQDKFVAGYIGTHGMAHGLETLLIAAERLRSRNAGNSIHLLFLGDGAQKQALIEQARAAGLDNVSFISSVPKAQVARHWSLLDVSIIHLRKAPLFTTVIPSKLFESMGMGIPVLLGVGGESAELVERHQIGLVFEPGNADALCDGLIRLQQDRELWRRLRENCIATAPHYSRHKLAMRMLDLLKATASGKLGRGRKAYEGAQ